MISESEFAQLYLEQGFLESHTLDTIQSVLTGLAGVEYVAQMWHNI